MLCEEIRTHLVKRSFLDHDSITVISVTVNVQGQHLACVVLILRVLAE